jgi:hypothetical protein
MVAVMRIGWVKLGTRVAATALLVAGSGVAAGSPALAGEGFFTDVDAYAAYGAPPAKPTAPMSSYVTSWGLARGIAYLGQDGNIYLLTGQPGSTTWTVTNVTTAAGVAGRAASGPSAYAYAHDHTHHVVYIGTDAHIHELWFSEQTGRWNDGDLTAATGAPSAATGPWARPGGFTSTSDDMQHVPFRAFDGSVWDLAYTPGIGWRATNASQQAGAPLATASPIGSELWYDTEVAYRGSDGYVQMLRFYRNIWHYESIGRDGHGVPMSANSEPTLAVETFHEVHKHVYYAGQDSHVHELWFYYEWRDADDTANHKGVPDGWSPSAYVSEGDQVLHAVYSGVDNTVYTFDQTRDGRWYHWQLSPYFVSGQAPLAFSSHDAADSNGYTSYVVYRPGDGHVHVMAQTIRLVPNPMRAN